MADDDQIGPGGLCSWCRQPYVWSHGAWWCPTHACRIRQRRYAVVSKVGTSKHAPETFLYVPTAKGVEYEESTARNRLLGGAASVAKSHILRWGMLKRALTLKNYEGLILRRTYGELEKSQLRRLAIEVPRLGGVYYESKYRAEFPTTGSMIEAGHLDDRAALARWLSTEYDDISADEGSTFDPKMLIELSTRARTNKPHVKAVGGARFNVGTNPGGPAWPTLLDLFVTHEPNFEDFSADFQRKYRPENWHYIKGTLDDNPYRDPDYEESLTVLGPARYEQLRWGAEFIADGQFFSELRQSTHAGLVALSADLEWSLGMDWGFNAPGWVGFFAHLADGHYHLAREFKFKGMTAETVKERIRGVLRDLKVRHLRYVTADPAMWQKTGAGKGESIAETLARADRFGRGLPMRKGDNDRFNGWQRLHEFLRDDGSGRPYLTIDPGCKYWWRSVPALVQDASDPDDVDTTGDDHAGDGTRYWAMSRPSPTRLRSEWPIPPKGSAGELLREARGAAGTRPVLGSRNVRRRSA